MMDYIFIVGILATLGGCLAGERSSLTRNFQSTVKKPRDVGTVARIDARHRSHIYEPSFDVVLPNVKTTMDGNPFDESPQNNHGMTRGDADYFRWTHWGGWSPCSRTCGGGISFRQRTCNSRYEVAATDQCEGENIEHKLCFTQQCPPGSQDFLEMQCSQQDGKLFHERNFKWIPFFGKEGNTCELTCMASTYLFYNSFGVVFDGTRCGKQRQGICVQGECVNIGCDGVLRSNATDDACGVCGGSNSTCTKYRSVVDQLPLEEFNVGYQEIATVPVGATHIRVKDYNENFLALTEGPSEKYILNGEWVVKWTGQFQAAGSIGTYERNGEEETLNIVGPITEELKIMVLIIGELQPLIEYEYWSSKNTSGIEEISKPSPEDTIIRERTEDDYRKEISEHGLDFDAISVPSMAPTTLPTTTTPISTTPSTTIVATRSKASRYGIGRQNPSCRVCQRGGNKKKHFCDSNFVFHVRVLPRRQLVRRSYIGYTVEVWHNYKSNVKVLRREYIWLPRACCPRLRPMKHYLVMGRASRITSNAVVAQAKRKVFKSPFIVSQVNFWYLWMKQNYKMIRMSRRLNCRRYRYNVARYRSARRRGTNTSR